MDTFNELKSLMETLTPEVDAFYNKDNKAAGRRARKALQDINKLTKNFRKEIQDRVNSLSSK